MVQMPVECYLQYLLKTICTINFAIYKYIWKYTYHCNHKQRQNDKTKDTNYTTKGTNVLGVLITRVLKLSALSIPPDYHLVIYLSRSRCKYKTRSRCKCKSKTRSRYNCKTRSRCKCKTRSRCKYKTRSRC